MINNRPVHPRSPHIRPIVPGTPLDKSPTRMAGFQHWEPQTPLHAAAVLPLLRIPTILATPVAAGNS